MKKQFPQSVETERLMGLIPTLADLNEYESMLQNKQFIDCYGVAFNKQEINTRLISDIKHWQQHGFGPWFWRDKESKEFVGRAGLKSLLLENKNEVELAYAISPEYWGNGIAVEISSIAIELAFSVLGLSELICFTRAENYQSLRVIEKLGFHYEKDFMHADMLHRLYRL